MNFTQDDIKRGFKLCHCGKKHILEAGTDYDKEAWVMCPDCDSWVIDEKVEK